MWVGVGGEAATNRLHIPTSVIFSIPEKSGGGGGGGNGLPGPLTSGAPEFKI